MENIVEVQFSKLFKRLALKNIEIDLDKSAKAYLAAKGYEPAYGARPLKRVIQREIENVLAEKILRGAIVDGGKVHVSSGGEHLVIK